MGFVEWVRLKLRRRRQRRTKALLNKAIELLVSMQGSINSSSILNKFIFRTMDPEFWFVYKDQKVKMYLPYAINDFIQGDIALNACFYEFTLLEKSLKYITKESIVLDVGANIGNHSVFWSLFSPAKQIFSFEPQRLVYDIMLKNLELNSCHNVKCYQNVVSSSKSSFSIGNLTDVPYMCNTGNSFFNENKEGDYKSINIDSLELSGLDFLKIDVEGHQDYVLEGAVDSLRKYKPVIWIEIFSNEFEKTDCLLKNLGYSMIDKLVANNFIYQVK